MHIAVSGSHGLIGSALVESLTAGGHQVTRLVRSEARSEAGPGEVHWDPDRGVADRDGLRGVDGVVHLAGAPITLARWTAAQKRRIRDSRVLGTKVIADAVATLDDGPRVLVTASGTGYYGDRGDEVLTTDSGPGTGFVAEMCRAWEDATEPAEKAGVRVVHMRAGAVQSPKGGALARQLPLFRLGIGGRLGSGRQYWSWITLDDIVGVYEHALATDDLSGPINATAPNPVTNAEYTRILASVVGRPALLHVPSFGPRLVFGELADAMIFTSARVLPERLEQSGYRFRYPNLAEGLRHVIGRG